MVGGWGGLDFRLGQYMFTPNMWYRFRYRFLGTPGYFPLSWVMVHSPLLSNISKSIHKYRINIYINVNMVVVCSQSSPYWQQASKLLPCGARGSSRDETLKIIIIIISIETPVSIVTWGAWMDRRCLQGILCSVWVGSCSQRCPEPRHQRAL